jgi:glycosyltransferase involved in cell wall biosynthesis
MVKIAFWFDAPMDYSGGLNYLKNLLYALSLVNDGSVRACIFFAADVPPKIERQFSPYAEVVKTKLLQRGTAAWFVARVLYKLVGSMVLVNALLKAHDISVLSHVWFVYKGRAPVPIIGWIPDFQYLHLPELFPTLDAEEETARNRRIIAQSDIMILSSHNAFEDFKRIAPLEHRSRGKVLQFVSQPGTAVSAPALARDTIEAKYGFRGPFFFLPNQFWAHKNHMVVLQAVKLLKDDGIDVLVLCSGSLKDYRLTATTYSDEVRGFIEANGLQSHVKVLGHIDYGDVLFLMRSSLAVLNPSRFEGWSSSVEEAKSMGKPVILSRIDVHVEQDPPNACYFDPDDAAALKRILATAWNAPADPSRGDAERLARDALGARTLQFGRSYLALVNDVVRGIEPACGAPRVRIRP